MDDFFLRIEALGERICILGPSNSGKSTLADAIGRVRQLPVIHLDQFHHLPGTAWQPRPNDEFRQLHDQAIASERWVIDGNYSACFPERLARSTGLVLLDVSTLTSLGRYLRRARGDRARIGGLHGASDNVTLSMLHHIAIVSPRNRKRYRVLFDSADVPKVFLGSVNAIARVYADWQLVLHDAPRAG
ncbi:AAA family ATPase [Luteibacter sp. UNCMF366Tsu5.1]|uniref:AAA family ATPase n=1 Tax=Luteibacter sp. UNCMF366Tsu5.1 TaxID=1502758 RepID=UPI000908D472|nr:AAA family ATPase [Luteibacter sp. UNCMF366Tsu5.1]SFW29431.1 hypothetical protein SAMN02800691_0831 [Luteibacter sp. UNCMF366Tsu5.1]